MSYIDGQSFPAGCNLVSWLEAPNGLLEHAVQGIVIMGGVMMKRGKVLYVT